MSNWIKEMFDHWVPVSTSERCQKTGIFGRGKRKATEPSVNLGFILAHDGRCNTMAVSILDPENEPHYDRPMQTLGTRNG